MKKIYVITGATSGIGKTLCEKLAKENIVFAGYRNKEKISLNQNPNITYFYIDMENDKSIKEAADFIKTKTDKIDTLINIAGCVIAGPIENIGIDRLRKQFDVNTFSHIYFTQNLLPFLSKGRIINISSMASFGHFPFISPYCASKSALDIFFNAMSIETHNDIKIISIKPGVISTPLWNKSIDLNMKYFDECLNYKQELECIKNNAVKNNYRGLSVEKVANKIIKIDSIKNPKPSYTIGVDAKLAHLMCFLPENIKNSLITFGLKQKMK